MRHGQTYLNKYNRIQGWVDSPLTSTGELESYQSGLGLVDYQYDQIVTSDLMRTIKTAEFALKENKYQNEVQRVTMPEFREFFFGSFEGLEAMPVWAKAFQLMTEEKKEKSIENVLDAFHAIDSGNDAENYDAFWKRIQAGIKKIVAKQEEENSQVLIVTHALTIDCIVKTLFPTYKKEGFCNNASLTKIIYDKGQYQMLSYNDCSHFQTKTM